MTKPPKKEARPTVRCAIYTRKSTEEGLEQEFNSLEAQRESGEAYIASMKAEGWTCLPERYDDGGFTGANTDRPALQKLVADIAARRVDTVVVYKVDRLSRSLMDFARLMESFERFGVTFVSVTQQFNTTHSMGRLTLNILLSFAQFEREIISERTRDKIAAARKKGKYVGGWPILGYDIQRDPSRLVVNEAEAIQVRTIFETYLKKKSLLDTARELARRGWTTKKWATKKGKARGGWPIDRNRLYNLLTNVLYIGKIRHHKEVYQGEHAAITDADLFEKVQAMLRRNHGQGGSQERNRYGALLKGLLRCTPCGCGMMHTYSAGHKSLYRYYVCGRAQKRGWDTCPSKSVPAAEIEQFVVGKVRQLGSGILSQATADDASVPEVLNGTADDTSLEVFDTVWEALTAPEKARALRRLVERVDFDGAAGTVSVIFRANGMEVTHEDISKEESVA
jgi:site-specific DNA recombinase